MEKIKNLFNTKSKKIIGLIVALIVFVASGFGVYALTSQKTYLKVKSDKVTKEYGEKISTDAKEYLDLSPLNKEDKEDVLKKVKVVSSIVNETDKDYAKTGKYTLEFTYEKEKAKVEITVKDTIKPTFTIFNDEVKVEVNAKDVKLEDYYKATDLTPTTITLEGNVDLATVGSYDVNVIATDNNGNKESKKSKITIVTLDQAYAGDVTTNVNGVIPASDELVARRLAEEEARKLAEEEAKKQQQNTEQQGGGTQGGGTQGGGTQGGGTQGGGTQGGGTQGGGTQGGGTQGGGTQGGGTQGGGTGGNTGSVTIVSGSVGNSGIIKATKQEAINYAEGEVYNENSPWYLYSYSWKTIQYSDGSVKYTIVFVKK